jgi:multidrug resistance protein, MATE family
MNKRRQSYFSEVLKLGYPLLAGMFAEYIMTIADSIMVGRLGTEYLAAAAMGGLVVEILWVFAWTMAPAVQTICARRFGIQEERSPAFTGEVFNAGLVVGAAAGILVLATSFASKAVLSGLVKNSLIVNLSMDYIVIIRWSIPISAFFYAIFGFLAGIKKTKQVMFATIGTNVLNITLNYFLIFGRLGFPVMGIKGAALGTVIAQAAGLVYFMLLIIIPKRYKVYMLFRFKGLKKSLFIDIGRTWLPLCFQYIISHAAFLVFEGLIGRFGAAPLAAMHVVLSVTWFGKAIVGGFAIGASILVGNSLGRRDKNAAVRYTYISMIIGGIIGFIIFMLCSFFPELFVRIFNSEPATLFVGKTALRFFGIFFFIAFLGHSIEMIFTHNGWSSYVFISDTVTNGIFTLAFPLIVLNVFDGGMRTAWLGYALYIVFFTVLLLAGFFSKRWTRRKVDSMM